MVYKNKINNVRNFFFVKKFKGLKKIRKNVFKKKKIKLLNLISIIRKKLKTFKYIKGKGKLKKEQVFRRFKRSVILRYLKRKKRKKRTIYTGCFNKFLLFKRKAKKFFYDNISFYRKDNYTDWVSFNKALSKYKKDFRTFFEKRENNWKEKRKIARKKEKINSIILKNNDKIVGEKKNILISYRKKCLMKEKRAYFFKNKKILRKINMKEKKKRKVI